MLGIWSLPWRPVWTPRWPTTPSRSSSLLRRTGVETAARNTASTPKRAASLLDICTSVVQGLLPYGAQLLYASAATKEQVSSFAIVPYCFYPMLMAVCVVGYILFSKKTK